MILDDLSGIPDWEDDAFDGENEGEEWKLKPTREAAKALYAQWKQVMIVLNGALDSINTMNEKDDFNVKRWENIKEMALAEAYQVAVKIIGSEAGMYMIRMESACIIRMNAQSIKSSLFLMISKGVIEGAYGNVIREEIDKFRLLFRNWVSTFEKDEYEDEWGLF